MQSQPPSPPRSWCAQLFKPLVVGMALCAGWAPAAVQGPDIPLAPSNPAELRLGQGRQAYVLDNNRWGAGQLTEGPAPSQYQQWVGALPGLGPQGEVSFRMKWRWPSPPGAGEVKGYPAILVGCKPGYYRADGPCRPSRNVEPGAPGRQRLQAGSTMFPMQLPVKSLKASLRAEHLVAPTGQGHLTFDLWLQSEPGQDHGFESSSITHEIMVPLSAWGGYGAHHRPGGRDPRLYDHDVVLGGRLYHVYATKDPQTGALDPSFGRLDGTYGHKGWKMIAFVPAVLPVTPGEIDLAAIVNHVRTRSDNRGEPWALGNEYLVSVELGVEPVVGAGDMVVRDFRVWR